jgi:hypothetical protein
MEFDWGILRDGSKEFHFFQSDLNKKPLKTKVKEGFGDLLSSLGSGYGPPLSREPGFRGSYVDVDVTCTPVTADLDPLRVGFVNEEGEHIELTVTANPNGTSYCRCTPGWGEGIFDPETGQILRDYLNRLRGVAQNVWDESNARPDPK